MDSRTSTLEETNPILKRERTGVQIPHSDTRLKFLKSAPAMKKRWSEREGKRERRRERDEGSWK